MMEGGLLKAGCLSPEVNRGELWLYHMGSGVDAAVKASVSSSVKWERIELL